MVMLAKSEGIQLDRRREAFCLAFATGASQTEAAREAGYKHPAISANRVIRQPAVKARIAELRGLVDKQKAREIKQLVEPTRAWVIAELCETVAWAKEAGDRGGTLKGLELVGRELGMFVQRTMAIESPLQRLPADRLLALLALVEEAVALPQVAVAKAAEAPELVTIDAAIEPETEECW